MRRICLGGSFNPIHVGHLICARAAAELAGFDGVRLIPTAANPHKPNADVADAEHRLSMCRLAVAGEPFFTVDPGEIARGPGPSYTYDTARALIDAGEPAPVAWLIGTDLLARLHTWHRFDDLMSIVKFTVMRRAGEPFDAAMIDPRVRPLVAGMVEVPQIEISSTAIRARVRAGQGVDYLIPAAVRRYIAVHGLYGDQGR